MNQNPATTHSEPVRKSHVRLITTVGLLSAIAFLLQFIEFPMPFSPTFAKFDFSDLPAIIGGFMYGPICGVLIELIKNLLQLPFTATGGVGELANFVIASSLIIPSAILYKRHKTKKTAAIGLLIGSILSGIVAAFMNYYVLLPLYESFMPVDEIIAAFSSYIPFIKTKLDVVLYNALPMNIFKSLVLSGVTLLVYKKLSVTLKGD